MRDTVKAYGCWAGSILLWELVLRLSALHTASGLLSSVVFSLAAAAAAQVLWSLPGRAGRLLAFALPPLLFLVYAVQIVYQEIFGSLLSLAYLSMGGAALATFWTIALGAIWRCLPQLLLLAVPMAGLLCLTRRNSFGRQSRSWRCQGLFLGGAAAFWVGAAVIIPLLGTGANSLCSILSSPASTVDRWAERTGLLTAEALDLNRLLFGSGSLRVGDGLDLTAGTGGGRNVLAEMDFEALDQLTDDQSILELDRYFSSLSGTGKNLYTGMFRDYNLIVVCAEAFSPYVMDPELTPTLWRMAHEGIVFENFYNSFPNLTTNGEYSLCMGLMPDLSRMSFATSVNNYAPFTLGSMFSAAGYPALAYHNNSGTFYNRINTHTNMGYTFKAIGYGLDMAPGSPTSDLEMMEKTVDDYLGSQPFHAYYMTYSGHADYSFQDNAISARNRDLVAGLEGSETLLAYIACQLELERAMTYLLQRLEEAGIADRTVVVLTGDHMPYGLPEADYAQLAGEAAEEPFWQYRNSFICWTGALEEPVVVKDFCCTQDILPTLLNLFGFSYDSRLLTGRDVLADCTHIALLKDGSFLTDRLVYDASTGTVTWREGEAADEDYAQALIQAAADQFTVAAAILDTDYYGFALPALGITQGRQEHETYASYADIAGTWYEEDVELLTAHGVLTGGGTGDFQGEEPVTRAALLAMVTRSLRLEAGEDTPPYTDLEEGQWYLDTVAAAWSAGLLPEGETLFRPDDPATVEEAAALLDTAVGFLGGEAAGSWGAETVGAAVSRQDDAGAQVPEGTLSRGAAAAAVADLLQWMEDGQDPF